MISKEDLQAQIKFNLEKTEFSGLGDRYEGKVRDVYTSDEQIILITSDRVSAFDRVLTTIPFKGQVLNQMAAFWFEATKDIVKNHVVDVPDPNVIVAKKVEIIPIEIVIRGYLTGSAWRDYSSGKAVSGVELPSGMKMSQKFDKPLFTPSTKASEGHDMPISKEEIISQGIIDKELMEKIEKTALALFERGTSICAKQGLILVDTKYEFGFVDGELVLADEMHTPDSSRFWYADTYEELFNSEKDQRMIDKEFLRQWLIREKEFMGDGDIPEIPDDIKVEFASRYIKAYEEITGKDFSAEVGDVLPRVEAALKSKGYLK